MSSLVVGAFALAYHGAPRFTGDLDVFVKPEPGNPQRIFDALDQFGFGSPEITVKDFTREDNVIQLGHPPVRTDLLTSITGVSWEEADASAEHSDYGGERVRYIGRDC